MKWSHLCLIAAGLTTTAAFAVEKNANDSAKTILYNQPGFFRFSYDNMKMPNGISDMGLLGLNVFTDFTPTIYGGVGAYGAITGSQGGLFTLGIEGGLHHLLTQRLWADAGLYIGGGGGRASLVGGGFMVRPHAGLQYDFHWVRVGVHYSYIDFVNGQIKNQQIGLDFDVPYDFYYVSYADAQGKIFSFSDISLFNGKSLGVHRNDFGLQLSAYVQRKGTLGSGGELQDGTISLVGAELDHYLTTSWFWSLRADGAYHGVPNGYMDVLGGVGYRWAFIPYAALVPQLSLGAGGGGNVDTGGGFIVQPQLGLEIPLTANFAARLNGGYLAAPAGQLKAATVSGQIFYHLDLASEGQKPIFDSYYFKSQAWRLTLFNQTYVHPQRVNESTTSPDNLIGLQIDQFFTPRFFLSYQAASAYAGVHAGGFATGMIGAGLQTLEFASHLQPYVEVLIGAGGGGGLQIGGGALVEPLVGLHYAMTPAVGLQASVGQVMALKDSLSTPVVNVGVTVRFGLLKHES